MIRGPALGLEVPLHSINTNGDAIDEDGVRRGTNNAAGETCTQEQPGKRWRSLCALT